MIRILRHIWERMLQLAGLLMLIRVPLLMVLAGVALSSYVAQIRELFDISIEAPVWALAAWVFSAGFGLLVWYSARTLYAFQWPRWQTSESLQTWLGQRLPRLLATAAPLTLAGAYWQAHPAEDKPAPWLWSAAYLLLAIGLWMFTTYRRVLLRTLMQGQERPLGVEHQPLVARYQHWHELPRFTRIVHAAGLIALPLSWLAGLYLPDTLDGLGPLALILGAASFSVWASTWPIYLAARLRFPVLTAMLTWASLMTAIGLNDNHAVRLTAEQQSDQDPPIGLDYRTGGRPSLQAHIHDWRRDRSDPCKDEVWLISSEGGGIRAAMWTVLVLSELHEATGGKLWRCTFAVSGVSGGSLGLAVFASAYRDLDRTLDAADLERLRNLLQADFLAPVLGSMFGLDAAQRFLPVRMFSDRGQALENAWRAAYRRQVLHAEDDADDADGDAFTSALADTLYAREGEDRLLPALMLNTTVVDTGLRLVQHPFSTLTASERDVPFPGVIDGADWLPRELPTFSAVHNSARFTLVSPAGSVLRREGEGADGRVVRMGQVVDGGYFENSGTTTLSALIDRLQGGAHAAQPATTAGADAATPPGRPRVRVIHISNDPRVPSFAGNGLDRCQTSETAALPSNAPLYGEARAPLVAILATRDARGEFARQALMDQVQAVRGELWHYRLCPGKRVLPLGWTLSPESTREMREQLRGNPNTASIVQSFGR